MTKTVTDEALELLKRCEIAMRNYFSSGFDGGRSFSILTADIPEFFKRIAAEPPAPQNIGQPELTDEQLALMSCYSEWQTCPCTPCRARREILRLRGTPVVIEKTSLEEYLDSVLNLGTP